MRCPFCAHENSQVKDSRPTEDGAATRRRRQCESCGGRFTTFERIQLREIVVMKNEDRPGVIGLLGSNLGAAGINIINFSLGATGDGHALAAITVDCEVSANQLIGLRTIPGIVSLEMF